MYVYREVWIKDVCNIFFLIKEVCAPLTSFFEIFKDRHKKLNSDVATYTPSFWGGNKDFKHELCNYESHNTKISIFSNLLHTPHIQIWAV